MIIPNDPKLVQAKDKILKKAMTDAAFRKALLADANSAIEKELGAKLPAGVKIKAVEDTPSTVHLVLPAAQTVKNSQLSDADLEKVSGGGDGCNVSIMPVTQKGQIRCNSTNPPFTPC
jgi:hypothetical protein